MENENLIDALERIKTSRDESAQMWLAYNLLNAKLVLPVAVDAVPDENGNVPKTAAVRYFSIKNTDGSIYLVTFTNADYFNEWQPDIHKYHVKHDYSQIVKMTAREGSGFAGIIIDPNHANVALPNYELLKIMGEAPDDMAVKADRIITDENIGLRPVSRPPKRLISALKLYMASDKSILSAHIMQTVRKGETTPTLILVVDFLGSAQKVFEGIARIAQKNMETNQPIGIMPASDKIAQSYIKNIEPFYKK